MFLSIIIPIWNDEKYLEECLDSCLNQALSGDEYEIICVDDGSTDRTPEILSEYERKHTNIHVIHAQHQGGGRGRMTGFGSAKGEFVWFVDHDDLIAPHAIDTLYAAYRNDPEAERFRFPYYEFFGELSEQERACYLDNTLKSNSRGLEDTALWPSIFSVDFLRKYGINVMSSRINEAKQFWGKTEFPIWGSDAIFVQECLDSGIISRTLHCDPLYFYRRSEQSETLSNSPEMRKKRETGLYNSALVNAYLAIKNKEQYYFERQENGRASFDTTRRTVMSIRAVITHLADLSNQSWKSGIALMTERHVFFDRIPEEYSYRFRDYWKSRPWKARVSPKNTAYYYIFLRSGALWYRFLESFRRILMKNENLLSLRRNSKRKKLQRNGMRQ